MKKFVFLDAKAKQASQNEANILKNGTRSQNAGAKSFVAQGLDSFEFEGDFYIIMEYYKNGDLGKYILEHDNINVETINKWIKQILLGVFYLHQANYIHRDLKPANLFIDDEFNIKIGDFGTAKKLGASLAHTLVGTPNYSSPEMLSGSIDQTTKTDIWSIGCILYEMITRKVAFPQTRQVYAKIMSC